MAEVRQPSFDLKNKRQIDFGKPNTCTKEPELNIVTVQPTGSGLNWRPPASNVCAGELSITLQSSCATRLDELPAAGFCTR